MTKLTLEALVERVVLDASEAEFALKQAVGHVARTAAKRAHRRKQLRPGFPVAVPCPGPDEAKAYFAQPKLLCLLCGKSYAMLPNHLRDTHRVTPDEYRAVYRLPWTAGLAGTRVAGARSRALKAKLANAEFAAVWFKDGDKNRQKAHVQARNQRKQPFRKELNVQRLKRSGHGPWEEADHLRILELMKQRDAVLRQVAGKVPGLPSYIMAVKWFNSSPARKQLLVDAVHTLSAPNQAKAGMLSLKVVTDMQALRRRGKLPSEIAAETGLSVMTVYKHLKRKG